MKVGITYDLRDDYLKQGFTMEETAEFDKQDTIDAIEQAVQKAGFETEKIGNVKALCHQLVAGKRWDIVFNICEGFYGIGREAQVPALLDAWNIPYVFSDPLVMALTLHKGMTKSVIRDAKIPTADFTVVHSPDEIKGVDLPFPLFVKPVAEGTGKGINSKSIIESYSQLEEVVSYLLATFKQPVLVEKFLSGREFTVGIVGTGENAKSISVMEVILKQNAEKNVYSYFNKEEYLTVVEYALAEGEIAAACEKVAIGSWRELGCQDGGRVDLRCDEKGIPHFIEVNPLAGLHPINSDLPILASKKGIGYEELIRMIMQSALSKIKSSN
jgi:D-alanine-D-alanine ligase